MLYPSQCRDLARTFHEVPDMPVRRSEAEVEDLSRHSDCPSFRNDTAAHVVTQIVSGVV